MEDHTLNYKNFPDSNSTHIHHDRSRSLHNIILLSVLPVEIIIGVLSNSWALAIIIRRRLWLQHEGYVYLGAILITSALILALDYGLKWFSILDGSYDVTRKADFICKAFNFFFNGFDCTGLLVLALLFNVCLRRGLTKTGGEETGAPNYRPSICALTVTLTLIISTLLMNIGQLVFFERQELYNGFTTEHYCLLVDSWFSRGLIWNWVAALVLHALPIIFILPVLFALIACSGCTCTGCKFGDNSRDHFPRVTLLSLAGIIHFLKLPTKVWLLYSSFLFDSYKFHVLLTNLFAVATIVDGFVLAAVPILCIVTMPKLREATFTADCCSCGRSSGTFDVEAIALRQAGPDN